MANPKEVLEHLEEANEAAMIRNLGILEMQNKELSEKLELALQLILKLGALIP